MLILFTSLAVSTLLSHRGDMWGGPWRQFRDGGTGGQASGREFAATRGGDDKPRRRHQQRPVQIRTAANPRKWKPTRKKFPEFTKEKAPHYVTRPSKILKTRLLRRPTPCHTAGGGSPALPYSQFTMNGATQGGMGFTGPGGGDFTGRFPTYVDGVRNRISSNWLQSTVDPVSPMGSSGAISHFRFYVTERSPMFR